MLVVYFSKVYLITDFGQLATHFPHKIHSLLSILPFLTMSITFKLISHCLSQILQLIHLTESALSLRDGSFNLLLIDFPRIINGDIQQVEWQKPLLPTMQEIIIIIEDTIAYIIMYAPHWSNGVLK